MFSASNIRYELADRGSAIGCGGIGLAHMLARRTGLIEALDRNLHLLKLHLPYWESDHVLNLAYNILAGGTCIEDLELLRNDRNYLDALGARRIPDPTTAGDFCRRFQPADVETLMNTYNEIRLKVWSQQLSPRKISSEPLEQLIACWRRASTGGDIADSWPAAGCWQPDLPAK